MHQTQNPTGLQERRTWCITSYYEYRRINTDCFLSVINNERTSQRRPSPKSAFWLLDCNLPFMLLIQYAEARRYRFYEASEPSYEADKSKIWLLRIVTRGIVDTWPCVTSTCPNAKLGFWCQEAAFHNQ
jgi:hypothetical protein